MSADSPLASTFTFESTAHPCHVLRYLDDQRQRDLLCDITVVVEGQSFRAHRSVLAACSEYFAHRFSSHAQHGLVISLPLEVTVAGFEPLLKFAYTSKLLFNKENVLEIRNSASILGFKDLDKACFDFLLPKFFSNSRGNAPFQRKTCCKAKFKKHLAKADCGTQNDDTEKEVKPVSDSPSEKEVGHIINQTVSRETGSDSTTRIPLPDAQPKVPIDYSRQHTKYRKFQLACGKNTCRPGKGLGYRPAAAIEDACSLSCLPCSSNGSSEAEAEAETPGRAPANQYGWEPRDAGKTFETSSHDAEQSGNEQRGESDRTSGEGRCHGKGEGVVAVKMEEETSLISESRLSAIPPPNRLGVPSEPSVVVGERSQGIILYRCPLKAFDEDYASTGSVEQECKEDGKRKESSVQQSVPCGVMRGLREALARESKMEGARDPDKGLDLDIHSASDRGSGTGDERAQSPALGWVKKPVFCPFLQDLDPGQRAWGEAGESGRPVCEGMSGAETGLSVSSLTSGEDGDSETETEGDSETSSSDRAREVQLPFSVDWIVDLSRNDFQQLLKQQNLTQSQLDFVHDMRRRSKNRIAAQRCRKRKLDCIFNLECEINKLRTEKDKLLVERSQLSHLKLKTWQTVSALCQKVCSEADMRPEQLQVIAKYTSTDCPLATVIPHLDHQ